MEENRHRTLEWPTVAVAAGLYAGFGALTWFHAALPWWLVLPAGGFLVAWHGSLQHEAVHGHPTSREWLNAALVFPSLWLWLPYGSYRRTHLRHHRNEDLTDPALDPESYYLEPCSWERLPGWRRAWLTFLNTAAGRLLAGPAVVVARTWIGAGRAVWGGDRAAAATWALHALSCTLVLAWVLGACGIPAAEYLALYVYPGISLTLLRSFAEHRASREVGERTAVVEAGALMSLLYLNNNLHAVHHADPGLAWYRLPARWRATRDDVLAGNGGYRYAGYARLVARYLLVPREPVAHPISRA